ncbi:fatty acid desaturase [uncultured Thiothrix sp.]|uniref:DesA family fatty acid desaturase n=1 Tax=uncultured Thiothrix sp. TaxID=223185 RepID=UPI00260864B7|nr:fatty acid desaturase [uncultured Thiothrix sp.]HMT91813.1 fatty acid desaturase [Thiolinea sp.]
MGLWSELVAWQLVCIALGLTHITIIAVTVFLHRSQTHRAVELGIIPFHFFRFWLWLTTAMITREWVAIHRKHHAKCETLDDPHSPQHKGLQTVLWLGAFLYRRESLNQDTLNLYGRGTPDDWLERNIYARLPWLGVLLMLLIDLALFGLAGLAIWLVQMLWIPFWAAGVINGLAHFWGYRNWQTDDASTNISPLGIIIGGEELHNNHHAFAASARLSSKWYEFDIGWMYIRLLKILGMAKVRNVAPRLTVNLAKQVVDLDTVSAVLGNRMHVLSNFTRQVTKPVIKAELCQEKPAYRQQQRLMQRLLSQSKPLDQVTSANLQQLLAGNQTLETVYQFQQRLLQLWERTTQSQETRLEAVQEWIAQAEKTRVVALAQFAQRLRGYSMAA